MSAAKQAYRTSQSTAAKELRLFHSIGSAIVTASGLTAMSDMIDVKNSNLDLALSIISAIAGGVWGFLVMWRLKS